MELKLIEYKEKAKGFVSTCLKAGWINCDEASVILEQINNDILTIGVVGQMKVGKSTLINSLVFGRDTLPTSETPMTASLTYISYGETFTVKIEMISESDFDEISEKKDMQANENIETREIKAAIELYEYICKIPNYADYFGKTIEVNPEQISNYIGANGEYTPLTKIVSLFIPDENLKGVNIVDTPGYNDPISSRDMTTKKFLSKANVIVCVQDILSVFTISDINLIKEQIPKSGIGKIVIAINKKDSVSSEELSLVIKRAQDEQRRLIEDPNNNEIKELLSNCLITPVSSIMAMIAKATPEILEENTSLRFFKKLIENDFPNLIYTDYLQESGIPELQNTISDIVMNQKKELVLLAPIKKLTAFLNTYANKCSLERAYLNDTNELLSDEYVDMASVLADLNEFEKKAVCCTANITNSCYKRTARSIENTTYTLRDNRNKIIKNIKFEEKKSKKYLKLCFNEIEEKYRDLNILFSNSLRDLGNNISEILHSETENLELQLDQIVLNNAELIHKMVIKRITHTITSNIPRTLGENLSLKVVCPSYWGRQDIYNIGIPTYFKAMIESDFSNTYINLNTNKYEDIKTKLIGTIEKNIEQIIEDTKAQFNANDAKDIETKITNNKERITAIDQILDQVNTSIKEVDNLYNAN